MNNRSWFFNIRFPFSIEARSSLLIGLAALCGCMVSQSDIFNLKYLKRYNALMPVAIIGSGPAGLTAGIYGARGGFKTYIFEGNKPGGLLTETTEVENWPGEEIVLGPELIEKVHKQAERLGVTFVADSVESIDTSSWPYKLTLESGDHAYALSIIVATGATPRRLGIPGESEYWGYGVTTCAVCDAPFRKGQDVIVIGGGDSAVEEAIQLAPHVRKVTLMVRKDHMRAASRMQDRISGYKNISVMYNVDVLEVLGEEKETPCGTIKSVTAVRVYNNKEKTEFIMQDIKGVFLAIGHTPNSQVVREHVSCDEDGYIKAVGRSQRTSQEGIFVAGDVADHVYRQAITSAGSGCMAALDAAAFLGNIGFNEAYAEEIEPNLFYLQSDDHQAVTYINDMQDFNQVIQDNDGVVVIDFYGQSCPSCLQMLPVYEQVARELEGNATFAKVDVDVAEDVVKHLNVVKVPCIMVFKGGKPQETFYKTMRRKELTCLVSTARQGN